MLLAVDVCVVEEAARSPVIASSLPGQVRSQSLVHVSGDCEVSPSLSFRVQVGKPVLDAVQAGPSSIMVVTAQAVRSQGVFASRFAVIRLFRSQAIVWAAEKAVRRPSLPRLRLDA